MEFSDLGKRCHYCNRQDYLPFQCDSCNNYFCKEHWKCHNCNQKKKEYKNIKCPLCFKKFILEENEDENNYISKHFDNSCSYFKEKCSFKKCKECNYLTECKKCKKKYCISHRHHEC